MGIKKLLFLNLLFFNFSFSLCSEQKIDYKKSLIEIFWDAKDNEDAALGALAFVNLFYYFYKQGKDFEVTQVSADVSPSYYKKIAPEIIKLIRCNRNINFFKNEGEKGFQITVEYINLQKIKDKYGVVFSYSNGKSIFLNCAKHAIEEFIHKLLRNPTVNLNQTSEAGFTALHYTVGSSSIQRLENRIKILDCLLEKNVSLNPITNRGWTPLHVACAHGNLWAVEKLIEAGADLHLRIKSRFKDKQTDDEDKTALDLANEYGHNEIVEYLTSKI